MPDLTLDILRRLVAFDTTNPPRVIDPGGIVAAAGEVLAAAGFELELRDLGDGCLNLLAVRGDPSVLGDVVVREIGISADEMISETKELDLLRGLELRSDPAEVVELSPLSGPLKRERVRDARVRVLPQERWQNGDHEYQ